MTNSADRSGSALVVGAGPTGLLLAAELQRRGVPCHLIDALPGPLHWDRATVVHPRSLEVFESLGLIGQFLDAGTKQCAVKIHSGGEVLGTMDLSTCGSRYGFNLGVSEEVTETILTDYLHRQGGQAHRSSRLVGLTPGADGATAEIEHDGERYRMNAHFLGALVEACLEGSDKHEASAALAETFAFIERSNERIWEAELYRLRGELKLDDPVEAEADFRRALEVARSQEARSLELRATVSLVRLLERQGKRDEARAMLADIYNWFTEGFDTADLKDAKVLLEELST